MTDNKKGKRWYDHLDQDIKDLFDTLFKRVSETEKLLKELSERHSRLDNKIVNVDERTGHLEEISNELKQMIQSHQSQLEEISNSIRQFSETLNTIHLTKEELDKIRQDMKETSAELIDLRISMAALVALPETLTNLSADVQSIKPIVNSVRHIYYVVGAAIVTLVLNTIIT